MWTKQRYSSMAFVPLKLDFGFGRSSHSVSLFSDEHPDRLYSGRSSLGNTPTFQQSNRVHYAQGTHLGSPSNELSSDKLMVSVLLPERKSQCNFYL